MGILDGKVVLVTGGGNGIGRECALIAAREGAKVVVNDLGGSLTGGDEGSAGPAETVAQEIRAAGGEAVSNSDSVTVAGRRVKAWSKQALDAFGGLHAVINPAGILRDGMFHKMSEADWDSGDRGPPARLLQRLPRHHRAFPRPEGRRLRALHLHLGPARQHRPDQLWRGQDGHRRPLADHRHGRRAQERALPTAWRPWPGPA